MSLANQEVPIQQDNQQLSSQIARNDAPGPGTLPAWRVQEVSAGGDTHGDQVSGPADEERGEMAFFNDQGPAAQPIDENSEALCPSDSRYKSASYDEEPLIQKSDRPGSVTASSLSQNVMTRSELNREFLQQQTWEIWIIFMMKLISSLIFLIDDLTFLVFCEYEFGMTQQEAGTLFCVSAMLLFAYGLTISGYLIDKMGVKYSLVLGFLMITAAKFMLTFADSLTQLYIIMCTIAPFGISIIFPCLLLGVKKLTEPGPVRSYAFSIFYAFMVLGALLGGPLVDFIRRDIGKTQFEYLHTNVETGRVEHRYIEVSAWRAICFFGFLLNAIMLVLLCTYDRKSEERFEDQSIDHEAIAQLTFADIFSDLLRDYKFWRFMLFSFVIVGSKMVFSLLFFMIPKMITQEDGENAPFGIYVSIAPLLIIVFMFILLPVQTSYEPYTLILAGTAIATLGPIPMFFGMNLVDFLLFVIIISFAEALYSPMINVFTFNFTQAGREGTFLTLTAAPSYFTMALTGVLGGYLLENYYPAVEDKTHRREPQYIWLTIIACSAVSSVTLYLGRDYFNCKEEPTASEVLQSQDDLLSNAGSDAKFGITGTKGQKNEGAARNIESMVLSSEGTSHLRE